MFYLYTNLQAMKRIYFIPLIALALLGIPFTAMQFSQEVNWSRLDFVMMFIMLLIVGFSIELVLRKTKKKKNRLFLFFTIIILFLLVWGELAVGIFGTPFAGS